MPIAEIELKDGRIAEIEVPEGTTEAQILAFVQNNPQLFAPEPEPTPAPRPTQQEISARIAQQGPNAYYESEAPTPTISAKDAALGIVEPALTIGSAMVAEPLAGWSGIGTALTGGTAQESAQAVESTRQARTYQPRSEIGQENVQAIGSALQPIGEAFEAAGKGLGDTAMDITGSPAIAAAAASLPTLATELVGLGIFNKVRKGTRLLKPDGEPTMRLLKEFDKRGIDFRAQPEAVRKSIPEFAEGKFVRKNPFQIESEKAIKKELMSGSQIDALAKFKLDKKGNVVEDLKASEAIGNGFREGTIQSIKTSSQATKNKVEKMLNIFREVRKSESKGIDIRPTDVVGDSVLERIKYMDGVIDDSSKQLDSIVKSQLKNKQINTDKVISGLDASLKNINVEMKQNPTTGMPELNFADSDIAVDSSAKGAIKEAVGLLTRGNPDAARAHQVKKMLDGLIDYRKSSYRGLTPKGERVIKDLRRALNDSIREVSPKYAEVNDKLKIALDATGDFDKSLRSIGLDTEGAGSAIGTKMRSLLSNNLTRAELRTSLNAVENATKQLGGKFDDDIKTLVMAADAIDDRFGTLAKTGFKGQTAQAATQAAEEAAMGSPIRAGLTAAKEVVTRAFTKSELQALEAMRDLLRANPAD